jgi:anti-sigma factor RsiW
MECREARELIVEEVRGTLAAGPAADQVRAHLSSCAACRAQADAERALSEVLETKLSRYAAPVALRRRIAAGWPASAPRAAAPRRPWRPVQGIAFAAALSAAVAVVVGSATTVVVTDRSEARLVEGEAVNDHLRVLGGAPLAQVTGGLHEVKPWFGGKLDFAPSVGFAGSSEFPLQGGAVEPFLDRRAAVFVYKRRLHTASLFVVPAEGLSFPERVRTRTVRGFNLALWRSGDQGYALVSDLSVSELTELQKQIASH